MTTTPIERLAALPVRKKARILSRWLPAAVIAAIVLGIGWAFATAPSMRWDVVGEFLFAPRILEGIGTTILFTILTFVFGLALGVLVTVMRQSGNPVLAAACGAYIWLFRGTPLLVQLVFWFNLALIFPYLGVRIPELGIAIGGDANAIVSPFTAAVRHHERPARGRWRQTRPRRDVRERRVGGRHRG